MSDSNEISEWEVFFSREPEFKLLFLNPKKWKKSPMKKPSCCDFNTSSTWTRKMRTCIRHDRDIEKMFRTQSLYVIINCMTTSSIWLVISWDEAVDYDVCVSCSPPHRFFLPHSIISQHKHEKRAAMTQKDCKHIRSMDEGNATHSPIIFMGRIKSDISAVVCYP